MNFAYFLKMAISMMNIKMNILKQPNENQLDMVHIIWTAKEASVWLFYKEDTIYDEQNLSNLVKICAKLRCSTIYSTLSIQTPGSEFVKLDFERIFKRVIENKNGGLCYERDEILFQLLKYIG